MLRIVHEGHEAAVRSICSGADTFSISLGVTEFFWVGVCVFAGV